MANRVVVMNNGRIEQIGTPEEVYHHPATPFVYNFLGNVNLFHGRVEDGHVYVRGMPIALSPNGHELASDRTARTRSSMYGPICWISH